MLNQFKYSVRPYWNQRLIALAATVAINVLFGVCGAMGLYNAGGQITAVLFSSLSLCALFVVNIIADFECVRHLFSAPRGYHVFLTPVPRWKILLGRVLSIVVLDMLSLAIGILGVTTQSLILADTANLYGHTDFSAAGWLSVILLIHYALLVLALFFACTLSRSVFFPVRGRGFLALLATVIVLYLFSLVDLALIPFGAVYRFGAFITVSVYAGPGMLAYIVLLLAKAFALFYVTSLMMERKINL